MADNVTLPGSGTVVAADDISSVWYQRVKLTDGTADSTTAVNIGNGAAANALRVTLPTDGTGVVGLNAGTNIVGVTHHDTTGYANGKTRISKRVAVTASATGTAIWDPTTGWRFVLLKLWVSAKTAGDIQIFDGTDSGGTVVSPIVTLNAGGGYVVEWPVWAPYRGSAVDSILSFTTGTVITGSVYVEGWEVNA